MAFNDYSIEQLDVLIRSSNLIDSTSRYPSPGLTSALLNELIDEYDWICKSDWVIKGKYDPEKILMDSEPSGTACGCMGPRRAGQTLCMCAMTRNLYRYRFDIARAIKLRDCI